MKLRIFQRIIDNIRGKSYDRIITNMERIQKKLSMVDNVWQFNNTKIYVPNYPLDFIQTFIVDHNAHYEEDQLKVLDKYIPENATILDIGANIGNHTLYWLISSPKNVKKIHCFEPVDTTYQILAKNIEINHLEDRAVTHNIGLCDEETKADIAFYIKSNIGGTKLRPSKENGRIQLKRLDDIEFNEDKIDFIKIDVEGLEYKVLNGARNLISKHKPLIFVEVANYDNVMKFFKELGYEIKESFAGSNYLFQYKG